MHRRMQAEPQPVTATLMITAADLSASCLADRCWHSTRARANYNDPVPFATLLPPTNARGSAAARALCTYFHGQGLYAITLIPAPIVAFVNWKVNCCRLEICDSHPKLISESHVPCVVVVRVSRPDPSCDKFVRKNEHPALRDGSRPGKARQNSKALSRMSAHGSGDGLALHLLESVYMSADLMSIRLLFWPLAGGGREAEPLTSRTMEPLGCLKCMYKWTMS